jgi:hypothetical protein
MKLRVLALGSVLSGALAVMCGTHTATPENEGAPCSVLSSECEHCQDPAPKESCQNAVTTNDDVQCAAVLDDPSVVASCASDGGAGDASPVDAGPLPACDPTASTAAVPCACAAPCSTGCAAGQCAITCAGNACSPSCAGGHCTFVCPAGATCEASCAGGGCTFDCQAGSTCANTCDGGDCTFTCENDAVCTDSCAVDGGCVGY